MTELLVPVQVDALRLARPERVVAAAADHEVLPWSDGERDHNGGTPYLSSAINAEPFSDHQHWLGTGVHLHWALPPGLTRGATRAPHPDWVPVGDVWFPPVPNRWVVRRRAVLPGAEPSEVSDSTAAWLIHSDHLYPAGSPRPSAPAAVYPVPGTDREPPWRYLGRAVELDPFTLRWGFGDDAPAGESLASIGRPLTALGPGDPAFAASYPACRNVFGFHDAGAADVEGELMYDVWGWYDGGVVDPLLAAHQAFRADPASALRRLHARAVEAEYRAGRRPPPEPTSLTETDWATLWAAELEDRFGWTLSGRMRTLADPLTELPLGPHQQPSQLRCHGRIEVPPASLRRTGPHPGLVEGEGTVVVAETASDAVSALLAASARGVDEQLLAEVVRDADVADHALDLTAALADAGHTATFRPTPGPDRWVLRQATEQESDGAVPAARPPLSSSLVLALDRLNSAQSAYDREATRLDGLRQQVFTEWHQTMVAAYPERDTDDFPTDPQALALLMERAALRPLESALTRLGRLRYGVERDGRTRLEVDGPGDSLAVLVYERYRYLEELVNDLHPGHALARVPGSRYWRPQDPVVLLDHPGARLGDRHRSAGPLGCVALEPVETGSWASLMIVVGDGGTMGDAYVRRRPDTPWNPLFLEWEVELRPDSTGNADSGMYDRRFVLDTQRLQATGPELSPRQSAGTATGFQYLAGRTLVNGSAVAPITARLARVRARPGLAPHLAAAIDAADLDRLTVLPLGGFHDALLMRRDEPQLPVDDPIGTPVQRARAARVRAALGELHPFTPLPDAVYAPLRSGELVVERLRLVDTFGQTVEWRPDTVVTSPAMRGSDPHLVRLPVRFSQAGRLDLRWLSASGASEDGEDGEDGDEVESNVHPETSPICGWLLPDHLDGGLDVYDAGGLLLGTVEADGGWAPAPGSAGGPSSPESVENPHLARVLAWIVDRGSERFIEQFLATLEAAGHGIDPSAAATSSARAVLIGRPLAVVRARLDLQLQHQAVRDVSPEAVRARLLLAGQMDDDAALVEELAAGADDHGFQQVAVPVRLGGMHRANDGLAGYWVESAGARPTLGAFVSASTQPPAIDVEGIEVYGEDAEPVTLDLTVAGPPTVVTMLLDPHGSVHAACGVFPTKAVSVPHELYADALDRLRVTFPTGPVLTPPDQVAVPLPAESGFSWSWLERDGDTWVDVAHHPAGPGSIRAADLRAGFEARTVARQGWLELRTLPRGAAGGEGTGTS